MWFYENSEISIPTYWASEISRIITFRPARDSEIHEFSWNITFWDEILMYRLDLLSKDEISGEKPCEKQSFFCMKLYVKYHVFILGIRNPADNSMKYETTWYLPAKDENTRDYC